MQIGITKVKLSADKSHQSRFRYLYAEVVITVGFLAVKCTQIASACGICGSEYLWHIVKLECSGKCELSHIASILRFDI